MKRLIECVPNFSEGRDLAKVDAIVAAMREVRGVYLLDRESDPDHNRSVITLAGDPEDVAEAAIRGVGRAAELIDLTQHSGAHPRMGAADVVPFIPISGITLDECVAIAKKVGREIWERFQVPVYFYEAAAARPERVNLENIRRGQFEGLRKDAQKDPERAPDIGGPQLHPTAGATVVGARTFLIAYNIYLHTPDAAIAKQIAKTIRFSSGGFPFVKAMGLFVPSRNLAQVSMNLTDFEQTPIHRVFQAVKEQAAELGTTIVGSEVVGLVPRRALELTAESYLQLENFSPAQVLENRLEESSSSPPGLAPDAAPTASLASLARPFLDAVARPAPTPGGGSVAALAGALGAALGRMVSELSGRKKSQAAHAAELAAAATDFQDLSQKLAAAIDRDAASYEAVMAAHKLPRGSAAEQGVREEAIQAALKGAIEAPFEIARRAADLFEKLGQLERIASPSMISDVRVGRLMAEAAVRGAVENVAVNLESVTDTEFADRARREASALVAHVAEHRQSEPESSART
jgi:glutamate formiminotransferase / formiminotetrahydrofolate cyclodeaminase